MKLKETALSPKSSKSTDDVKPIFSGQQNHDLKNLFLTTVQSCCVFTAGLRSQKQSRGLYLECLWGSETMYLFSDLKLQIRQGAEHDWAICFLGNIKNKLGFSEQLLEYQLLWAVFYPLLL